MKLTQLVVVQILIFHYQLQKTQHLCRDVALLRLSYIYGCINNLGL